MSHLFATQTQVEVLEISQASAGEAWAALEAGDVGQRREVVAQQRSIPTPHVHDAVAETRRVGLGDGASRTLRSCTLKAVQHCNTAFSVCRSRR